MSTLADELLNDFEDSESEGEADRQNGFLHDAPSSPSSTAAIGRRQSSSAIDSAGVMVLDVDEEDDEDEEMTNGDPLASGRLEDAEDEEEAKAKVEKMQLGGINDVRNVAGLMKTLEPVLQVYISCEHSPDVLRRIQKIAQCQALPPDKQTTFVGSIEDNPEYHLLTQSNTLSTSIDNEIILVHKFIRDHYSTRFPELETLVTNPLDYAKSVAIIGNGPMDNIKELAQKSDNIVGAPLKSILDGPSLMVVTVESTTTRGREMSSRELQTVLRACEMTLSLDRAKKILTEYVQSRMNLFAPNLTALIGSLTAAQLLNFAGGLTGLAKTPACNIPPLGSKKQSQTGFATNVGVRHQGFLYHSPIIRGIPSDLKRQAMRIVAAKCVLAARVDRVHASPDGSNGLLLKNDTLARLEKLTEPPPNKGPRALPAPDDKPSRKRGGRRARKAKEATAMTDLRKAQNRMAFGKEEKEVGYGTGEGTKGLGMIGQANDGRIRGQQIDQRTKAKLSKSNKGWGGATPLGTSSSLRGFGQNVGPGANSTVLRGAGQHGLRTMGVGGMGTSGTASSVAFTPVQGLELVDPKAQVEMRRKQEEEADRWFKGGTFTQLGNGSGATSGSGTGGDSGSGGFKVPGLPARKMGPPPVPLPPSPLSALGAGKK
ncbi:U4/U6-U5 snRNP complex subunit prp31 [Sticta canariensis]|nr:U4/U6-U5 snRNP complex subunit prp31 [Sticta canariensis]